MGDYSTCTLIVTDPTTTTADLIGKNQEYTGKPDEETVGIPQRLPDGRYKPVESAWTWYEVNGGVDGLDALLDDLCAAGVTWSVFDDGCYGAWNEDETRYDATIDKRATRATVDGMPVIGPMILSKIREMVKQGDNPMELIEGHFSQDISKWL